jgi:hypothetical protein
MLINISPANISESERDVDYGEKRLILNAMGTDTTVPTAVV